MALFQEEKAKRFDVVLDETTEVTPKKYNAILGGVTLWGLISNVIICMVLGEKVYSIPVIPFLIVSVIMMFTGIIMSAKSDKPAISFLGFNLVCLPMGVEVTYIVSAYASIDKSIVYYAFIYTALITAMMLILSVMFPSWFLGLGKVLFISLICIVIVRFIGMFIIGDSSIVSFASAAVFSLYIGYDFQRAQKYPKTIDNAIDCAVDLYMDIINLFLELLKIIAKSRD